MGDAYLDIDDLPVTVGTLKTQGDIYPAGADQPMQRFIEQSGTRTVLSTQSAEGDTALDPETGETISAGLNTGIGQPFADYIRDGLYNAGFTMPPPIFGDPIAPDNPLPYWTTGGTVTANYTITLNTSAATANFIRFNFPSGWTTAGEQVFIEQIIPVNGSEYAQEVMTPLIYATYTQSVASNATYRWSFQYLTETGAPTGTAYEVSQNLSGTGTLGTYGDTWDISKVIPSNARFARLRIGMGAPTTPTATDIKVDIHQVRIRRSVTQTLIRTNPSYATTRSAALEINANGALIKKMPTSIAVQEYVIPAANLVPLAFHINNIPTSANDDMSYGDIANNAAANEVVMPWPGHIVGISYRFSAAVSNGGANPVVYLNGTESVGYNTTDYWVDGNGGSNITSADLAYGHAKANYGIDITPGGKTVGFVAGARIGMKMVTTAAWTQTGLDAFCVLWVALEYDGDPVF